MADDRRRRAIRPGELLAIRPDFVQEDRGAFFWLFAPAAAHSERCGSVAVVRVNGPLEYHDDGWGDSYESIVCRVGKAMSGQDAVDRHRREHRWDEDFKEIDATPAKCVVLRIESPGGVVAGLDQTVRKLRSMSRDAKVPIYAYVDEMAYSAGFALCCAASEIYLPRSGFLGSIGVISTMVDQTAADKKLGYKFVVLTSGERKADGHPHVPISDAMIAEEAPRVTSLARQFYAIVKRARGVSVSTIQGWQAKRFLGAEATRSGLADGILSWDEFMGTLTAKYDGPKADSPPSVAQSGTRVPYSSAETANMLAIDALIARKEAAIKSEKDPTKLAALYAEVEAAKKTKKMTEEEESSTADEEEAAAKKSKSKGDETDRSDDEEDDEEDDDEDDAKKGKNSSKKSDSPAPAPAANTDEGRIAAMARELTGKSDVGAVISALQGIVAGAESVQERMAVLERRQRQSDRNALVDRAVATKRITAHEAKQLRTKRLEFVEQVINMRPAGSVLSDEHAQFAPGAPPEAALAQLPESVRKQLEMAERHAKSMGMKFDSQKAIAEVMSKTNGKAEV